MKTSTTLATAILAALALPAAALDLQGNNMSYTYAELGYTDRDFDGPDADGFLVRGSVELTDMLFVQGGYTSLSGDGDIDNLNLGIGAAVALLPVLDAYAQVNYLSSDLGWEDDTGFGLEAGVRGLVADRVEAFANLQYVDIFDDNDTAMEIGARYWHVENIGVSASYTDGDFIGSGFTLAGRFNF